MWLSLIVVIVFALSFPAEAQQAKLLQIKISTHARIIQRLTN